MTNKYDRTRAGIQHNIKALNEQIARKHAHHDSKAVDRELEKARAQKTFEQKAKLATRRTNQNRSLINQGQASHD